MKRLVFGILALATRQAEKAFGRFIFRIHNQDKLTPLLKLKYHDSIPDAVADLGAAVQINEIFVGFQKFFYVFAPRMGGLPLFQARHSNKIPLLPTGFALSVKPLYDSSSIIYRASARRSSGTCRRTRRLPILHRPAHL